MPKLFILLCPVFSTDQQVILWVPEVFFLSRAAGIGVGRKPTHLTAQEKSLAPRLGKRTSCYNTEERMASVNATTRMKLKDAAAKI